MRVILGPHSEFQIGEDRYYRLCRYGIADRLYITVTPVPQDLAGDPILVFATFGHMPWFSTG